MRLTARTALAIAAIAAALCSSPADAQTTFTQCAPEGGTCTLTAPKLMRYGQPFTPAWTATRTVGPGSIPCTNAYWTDPSPGTGKRCEIMDAPTAPPPLPNPAPAPAPAPSWGTKLDLTWTAPTTNTDGTPICGPLRYQINIDGVRHGETTALAYTATGIPAGNRCATVQTIGSCGISDPSGQACATVTYNVPTPPCYGKQKGGTGTSELTRWNGTGFAVLWLCETPTGWEHHGFFGRWDQLESDWGQQQAAADTKEELDALWRAKIKPPGTPGYDAVRPLYDALKAATPLPGAEIWTVRALVGSTSRPATAIVNGLRTNTVVGRVGIGMACDCKAHRSGTNANTYCAVTGQSNVATAAVDVLPASAAICARVP